MPYGLVSDFGKCVAKVDSVIINSHLRRSLHTAIILLSEVFRNLFLDYQMLSDHLDYIKMMPDSARVLL